MAGRVRKDVLEPLEGAWHHVTLSSDLQPPELGESKCLRSGPLCVGLVAASPGRSSRCRAWRVGRREGRTSPAAFRAGAEHGDL